MNPEILSAIHSLTHCNVTTTVPYYVEELANVNLQIHMRRVNLAK